MGSSERWQVSGDEAHLYELHVASWFAPWAADLVDRADLQPGWRVLDVACGTGVVTRAAGPALGSEGEVVATDLNDRMLAEAQTHPVEGAGVRWQTADAADLPFESGTFDAVLCQQGLQFVPEKAAAVAEMRRVLRPGGSAAVSVWCAVEESPYIAALANGLTRHLSVEAGRTMMAPSGFGDRVAFRALFTDAEFASVELEDVELMRTAADVVEAVEGNLSALPIADQIRAMDPSARMQMTDDIVASLDEFIVDDELAVPTRSLVVIATA